MVTNKSIVAGLLLLKQELVDDLDVCVKRKPK